MNYIVSRDQITDTPPRHSLEDAFITGDIRFRKYSAENFLGWTPTRGQSDCALVAFAFAEDTSYLEAMRKMGNLYKKDWGTHREPLRQFLLSQGYQEKRFLFQITLFQLWATGFFTDDVVVYLNLYDTDHDQYHELSYRRLFFGDFLPSAHIVKAAYIKPTNKETSCQSKIQPLR